MQSNSPQYRPPSTVRLHPTTVGQIHRARFSYDSVDKAQSWCGNRQTFRSDIYATFLSLTTHYPMVTSKFACRTTVSVSESGHKGQRTSDGQTKRRSWFCQSYTYTWYSQWGRIQTLKRGINKGSEVRSVDLRRTGKDTVTHIWTTNDNYHLACKEQQGTENFTMIISLTNDVSWWHKDTLFDRSVP